MFHEFEQLFNALLEQNENISEVVGAFVPFHKHLHNERIMSTMDVTGDTFVSVASVNNCRVIGPWH